MLNNKKTFFWLGLDFLRGMLQIAGKLKQMKEKWIFENKWLIFYFVNRFDLSYEVCGYFDNRPRINICLFFFSLTLILPFPNKWTDECDPPKWGIAFHNDTFWIYKGGEGNMGGGNKWITFNAPWQLQWVRTSTWLTNGQWFHETKKNRHSDPPKELVFSAVHPYEYRLKSGEVQKVDATISVEEREWRWHWFNWLSLTKKVRRTIEVDFSGEVGERAGSWKGGCVGCSYELLGNETPFECLKRMERERKF